MITCTIDLTRFNARTNDMLRAVPQDVSKAVADTARLLAADLSSRAAMGKVSSQQQQRSINRDINRSARQFPTKGWNNPRIQKLIQDGKWDQLEAKFRHMNSDNRVSKAVRQKGLDRFHPHLHSDARRADGTVPRTHDAALVTPGGETKAYKGRKVKDRGKQRAGWAPAGQRLGSKASAFPSFVTRHGQGYGAYQDGLSNRDPYFVLINRAPGVDRPWWKRSFDWWSARRAKMATRAFKKMVQEAYRRFNAGGSVAGSYGGQAL